MNNTSQKIMSLTQEGTNIEDTSIIIPTRLKIIIRTSIPGYQKIKYKPSMTIKDIDSSDVMFNPLMKLNKSAIEKIPKNYKIKQFFNTGLFQSLLNYTNEQPAKNLNYATRAGYVDNNIKVTIDTIFPINSVIYIGENSYVIGDVQWTTGDWKVEVKQNHVEVNPDKITDPLLYTKIVRDEIISGEKQLNQLPKSIVFGNNYSGPQPITQPTPPQLTIADKPITQTKPPQLTIADKPTTQPKPRQLTIDYKPITQTKPPQLTIDDKPTTQTKPPQLTIDDKPTTQTKPPQSKPLQLTNDDKPGLVEDITSSDKELMDNTDETYGHVINNRSTNNFMKFFKTRKYYDVANEIFKNLHDARKKYIKELYTFVTQKNVVQKSQGLSPVLYSQLCDQVNIYKTVADGNCFFDAVSFGINKYNFNNPNNKIVSGQYGISQLFTIAFMRDIVFIHYETLDISTKEDLVVIGTANVNNLNEKFKNSLTDFPITSNDKYTEEYMNRIDIIYQSDENFFVNKPMNVPYDINETSTPFKLVSEGQIENYIRSKYYWGDQFAMSAICNILHLFIIPIDKSTNVTTNKKSVDLKYLAILAEPDRIESCSKKIMFLYRDNLHYELIDIYYNTTVVKNVNSIKQAVIKQKSHTIFNIDNLPPPYHILILIYGSNYVKLDNQLKQTYFIYPQIMKMINDSVVKILNNSNMLETSFTKMFDNVFSLQSSVSLIRLITRDKQTNQSGGDPPYGYINTQEQQETSKIAYAITIDMELRPGTSLSPDQLNEIKCNSKYNAIRRSFSEFTGRPYIISPVYSNVKTKKSVGGKQQRVTRKRH